MDFEKIIDINFDKKMHKKRDNGLLLSDEQIEILNEEYNEELDKVSGELAEFNYYNNTNK